MSSTPSVPTNNLASPSSDSLPVSLTRKSGRLYIQDPTVPYPLPCDLGEINRQTLRSMVLLQVFDAPYCAPYFDETPPKKVLEVACGSATWSTVCHDYCGPAAEISFTGLDILPLAPDLSKSGLKWQFVQHDLRKQPLPFPDGHFDFVFVKDTGLCLSAASLQAEPLSEFIRVLKSGGALEIWDSDYIIRTLLPNPPIAPGLSEEQLGQVEETATYTISAATPFAPAQNVYIKDFNAWATKALERRKLTGVPCAFIGMAFSAETDSFRDYGNRRIAIPLAELRWEKDFQSRMDSTNQGNVLPEKAHTLSGVLSANQLALRKTTLNTILQMIDGLEPLLMEASGKTKDEWNNWWAGMVTDLLHNEGAASGECLEVGAWWAQKK